MRLKSWTPLEIVETILAFNLLVWGIIFLFPENVFDTPSIRIDHGAFYAQDWFWGIFLIVVAALFLFGPRDRSFWLRRYLHIFCWIFWFSITLLLALRTFSNGIAPTDFLFISVFVAIALCHLTLYNRLVGVK